MDLCVFFFEVVNGQFTKLGPLLFQNCWDFSGSSQGAAGRSEAARPAAQHGGAPEKLVAVGRSF